MFVLQETPIDITKAKNSHQDSCNGALTSFEGIVRSDKNKDKEVGALLYIADAPACIAEGEKILGEARSLFSITDAVCVQRTGRVSVGEIAVWIGVWAGHRDQAFQGCRYVIEEIKKRLLIWKKEIYTDGTSQWIHGRETSVLS
jgi:molybdopterin synthase catalytic subunit